MKTIHIFRAGTHTSSNGKKISFTRAELERTAGAYDPARFEAPLVVGHPETNAPSYGWIERLDMRKDGLFATPHQVAPELSKAVKDGRFKKISASFYLPDAEANPAPGAFYLRHVGFLGAAAPAVKGLTPVAFNDAEEGVVAWEADFAETTIKTHETNTALGRLAQALRIWLARENAPDTHTDNAAQQNTNEEISMNTPGEPQRDDALAEERAALAQDRDALNKDRALLNNERVALHHARTLSYVDGLIACSKLSPSWRDAMAQFLVALPDDKEISFAQLSDDAPVSLDAFMRRFLEDTRASVPLGEAAPAQNNAAALFEEFRAPAGFAIDPARLDMHTSARRLQHAHPGMNYTEALRASQASHPHPQTQI